VKPKDLLLDDETLFKNEEVFTPSYVPEQFIHRDPQLKALAFSLKPGMRGVNPINTLVHGPPGTGKTTAVLHVFNQLREAEGKLFAVYVNCEHSNTRFSVFAKIHEAILGHAPPDTGKPLDAVKERAFLKLRQLDKSLIVALDEIDQLFVRKNVNEVLIDLLKTQHTYGYSRVGVVGVMIDDQLMTQLDVKTRSVFNPERIHFQPYARSEILDILQNRADSGFYPGVISKKILEEIAEKTAQTGDLRVGINLLRKSAYLAERDSSRKITAEHMEKAYESEARLVGLEKTLKTLSKDEKELLNLIASNPRDSIESGELYELFNKKTKSGIKKYNEIIAKLEFYKLIDAPYTAGVKGRTRNIILRHDKKDVLSLS